MRRLAADSGDGGVEEELRLLLVEDREGLLCFSLPVIVKFVKSDSFSWRWRGGESSLL